MKKGSGPSSTNVKQSFANLDEFCDELSRVSRVVNDKDNETVKNLILVSIL